MDIKNKKEFVIQEYLKNPNLDLSELANKNNICYSHVTRTVKQFKSFMSIVYPIFCEKSLSECGVYYLFAEREEKKIKTVKNYITNDPDLTDYEKRWLEINKQIFAD